MTADITPENVARMSNVLRDQASLSRDLRQAANMRNAADWMDILAARLVEVAKDRDHWHDGWKRAMVEFDTKCKEANAQRARAEAAEAENAKLREFFDAVDAFSAIPRPSPTIEMIERINRARAALQPKVKP